MNKRTLFEELKFQLQKTGEILMEAPWHSKDFYAAWLIQTHSYVKHSTRLLALAGAVTPFEYQEYHNRFLKHAAEEKGHENLPLLDLKNINSDASKYPEFPATQSFYQTQYYWIQNISPMAFYGYILCLECMATEWGPALTKKMQAAHGPKAAHFMSVHSEDDVDHVEEAIKRVEKLPADVQKIIFDNMIQSFENYNNIIESCCQVAVKKGKAAA